MKDTRTRWNPLRYNEEGVWKAGPHVIDENCALIFVRLPVGFTTLGRIDELPFVHIHEFGVTMLINVASPGILVFPVE
tara:strand:+ start:786 stop:1019 length:234 start_codon:yes stop_codon:yes gene_type:complete